MRTNHNTQETVTETDSTATRLQEARQDVERRRAAHREARDTLNALEAEEPRFLSALEDASTAGDHQAVVDLRAELDGLGIKRWSAKLAERRAMLTLRLAEEQEAKALRAELNPHRLALEERVRELQRELNELRAEIGDARVSETQFRQSIADLRRQIGELERSEAAWAPVVRGKPRTA